MKNSLIKYYKSNTEAAPLAAFRILFGILMLISTIRFWYHGWIEKLYINPIFHFKYYGFDFIKVPGTYTYLLFIAVAICCVFISLGYMYRISMTLFFVLFTYIELMDKTTYLNHYYFVSVLSFLLIFLPANAYFSLDAKRNPSLSFQYIPRWTGDSIKFLLFIVYFYAGLAKLNKDWLLEALPLKIWLPSKFSVPILGDYMHYEWVHYLFSWSGAIYDLTIVFFLIYKRTRPYAFILVVIFHVLTRVLFDIGMFPYIMIMATLIFFDATIHKKILKYISVFIGTKVSLFDNQRTFKFSKPVIEKITVGIICLFMLFQIIFPFRHLSYPGNLYWTEQGYRFSWRVMLMEKTGYAQFKIVDSKTGKRFYVDNRDFLSSFQEKQMSTQADFILEYGQYLGNHFTSQGHENIQVFVESYVSLNGRGSTEFINPETDLMSLNVNLKHKTWILPLDE